MLRVGIVGCGNIFTMHATSCDNLIDSCLTAQDQLKLI